MKALFYSLNAAIWVTCSPHEWEWTHEQQVAMARYCVEAAKVISIARNQLEMIVCTEDKTLTDTYCFGGNWFNHVNAYKRSNIVRETRSQLKMFYSLINC